MQVSPCEHTCLHPHLANTDQEPGAALGNAKQETSRRRSEPIEPLSQGKTPKRRVPSGRKPELLVQRVASFPGMYEADDPDKDLDLRHPGPPTQKSWVCRKFVLKAFVLIFCFAFSSGTSELLTGVLGDECTCNLENQGL